MSCNKKRQQLADLKEQNTALKEENAALSDRHATAQRRKRAPGVLTLIIIISMFNFKTL